MVQAIPDVEHVAIEIDESPLDEYQDLPIEKDPKSFRCYTYSVSFTTFLLFKLWVGLQLRSRRFLKPPETFIMLTFLTFC